MHYNHHNSQIVTHSSWLIDGERSVLISRSNLPQIADDMSSGQSSPTEPVSSNVTKSEDSDETPRIDTSQVITTTEDLQSMPTYYPPNPYTPNIRPTMQTSPNIQYQPSEPSTHNSTSPQELKRKRELSSGTNLVDRTRPVGMAHYPYPIAQPHMDLYDDQVVPQEAGATITHQTTEVLPTEPMMPYGYPYYYTY